MPRFLNTWTGEFEWHHDPAKVQYAILSHFWRTPGEGGEQSYDEVRRIQAGVLRTRQKRDAPGFLDSSQASSSAGLEACFAANGVVGGTSGYLSTPDAVDALPLNVVGDIFLDGSPLSDKIKGFCGVAREAGFRLVWNDACCIDKSSSAELSEAINSMFEWYRLSDMCYVYLADVPDVGDSRQEDLSPFRWSKWHKRGWTLQELIAPERIEFLTSSWRFLGTKLGLLAELSETTGVDVDILAGRAPVDSASVAQRMSWAAKRETTRVEDEAYCLMGLFGVHMSPIYGEGQNAFLRLQEEIIRTIPDQSIFAWGRACIPDTQPRSKIAYLHTDRQRPSLLAPSPFHFGNSNVVPMTTTVFASRLRLGRAPSVPPLDCVFAPQGVRMRLLCLDLTTLSRHFRIIPPGDAHLCEGCMLRGEPDRLALLQCEDDQGNLVALPLHPPASDVGSGRGRLIGSSIRSDPCNCHWSVEEPFHTVLLSREVLAKILRYVKPKAAKVAILRRHVDPPTLKPFQSDNSLPHLDLLPGNSPDPATFALAPGSITALRSLGFSASSLQVTRSASAIALETTLVPCDETPPQDCDDGYQQSLSVKLSLEEEGSFESLKFSFAVIHSLARSPGSLLRPGASGTSAAPPAHDIQEAPCIGYRERIRSVYDLDVQCQHTLAYADFLIPSYPARRNESRLLRLSLERPSGGPTSVPRASGLLWLVVEMSGRFEHVPETDSTFDCSNDASEDEGSNSTPEIVPGADDQEAIQSYSGAVPFAQGAMTYPECPPGSPSHSVAASSSDRAGRLSAPRTPPTPNPSEQLADSGAESADEAGGPQLAEHLSRGRLAGLSQERSPTATHGPTLRTAPSSSGLERGMSGLGISMNSMDSADTTAIDELDDAGQLRRSTSIPDLPRLADSKGGSNDGSPSHPETSPSLISLRDDALALSDYTTASPAMTEKSMYTLQLDNAALRAELSSQHAFMMSRIDTLASQVAALSRRLDDALAGASAAIQDRNTPSGAS